jgi:hypothetical protein
LGSRVSIYVDKFFSSSSLEGVSSLILFPLFASSVIDTKGSFTANVVDNGSKFVDCGVNTSGKFTTAVVDTGGKFASGVVYTNGAPFLANISANFPKNF